MKDMYKPKYDDKCDVYSLGLIFHILYNNKLLNIRLAGKSPFTGKTINNILIQN